MPGFKVQPIEGVPQIKAGCDLAAVIKRQLAENAVKTGGGEIFVVAQKIVSKSEGRLVALADVKPSKRALELAEITEKDPRLVELILTESKTVLRAKHGVLITVTNHGFVCANAGIDSSNIGVESDCVLLLPKDPDRSAGRIREALQSQLKTSLAVIISDSFGRAWRTGQCDVAIGSSGLQVSNDLRGTTDSYGRELQATEIATADQITAAADLARSKTSNQPVVMLTGLERYVTDSGGDPASSLIRPPHEDLFLT